MKDNIILAVLYIICGILSAVICGDGTFLIFSLIIGTGIALAHYDDEESDE